MKMICSNTQPLLQFLLSFASVWSLTFAGIGHPGTKLLMVSFDGFRYDYLDLVKQAGQKTRNFDRLVNGGVRLEYLVGVFPSKTIPSHHSITTGMLPENHGIIANRMYDSDLQEFFQDSPAQKLNPVWWYNGTDGCNWPGEPIWIRNQEFPSPDGVSGRSGTLYWPGVDALYCGKRAHRYENNSIPTKSRITFEERIEKIVSWFTDEEEPINFGLLYFSEPDHAGHRGGPNSSKVVERVLELDKHLGDLISKLEGFNIFEQMNIIVLSDHGMTAIKDCINLEDHLNVTLLKNHYGQSPNFQILPKEGELPFIFINIGNVV